MVDGDDSRAAFFLKTYRGTPELVIRQRHGYSKVTGPKLLFPLKAFPTYDLFHETSPETFKKDVLMLLFCAPTSLSVSRCS